MAIAKSNPPPSQAEYLEMERRAEGKSEFLDGEIFAMSGGTREHSLIATNLAGELRAKLKGRPCTAYNSDLRVKVEAAGLFTYPDVSVVCGDHQFEDDHRDTLLNPTIIFEVLSESREAYDRGKKFEIYRRVPSLKEYLLVSQYKPQIEQFIRQQSGEWLMREIRGLNSELHLPSLNVSLLLSEVFDKVEFHPGQS